jgi:hypothetical protein
MSGFHRFGIMIGTIARKAFCQCCFGGNIEAVAQKHVATIAAARALEIELRRKKNPQIAIFSLVIVFFRLRAASESVRGWFWVRTATVSDSGCRL